MAVDTSTFADFLIKIGDGASPEVFTGVECGLKTKNWKITADSVDTVVPDCTDPDSVVWPVADIRSLSFDAGGSGIADTQTSFEQIRAWIMSGATKNARVYPAGASGGYFSGPFVATSFGNAVNHGEKTTFDFAIKGAGTIAWTAGS